MIVNKIDFPKFSGVRCLMMPYIQGNPDSVPDEYRKMYKDVIERVFIKKGDVGYLTIDESVAKANIPHRGYRSKYGRALHTEAGLHPDKMYAWGDYGWGRSHRVTLDRDVEVLLANSIDDSCALWETEHYNTSIDGDIGNFSEDYPYESAVMMKAGEVHKIGILTPHESLPIKGGCDVKRQFLRIVSSGVHGREKYFTTNPLM